MQLRVTTATRVAGVAGALALASCSAQAVAADAAPMSPPHTTRLVRAMDKVIDAGAPGMIVYVRDGKRTLSLARGVSDRRRRTPMRPTDRFRIGSVTKTFVAATALLLVRDGKLSLDDTIETWLPGLVPNGASITVRQLLHQTTGIQEFEQDVLPLIARDPDRTWTPEQLIRIGVAKGAAFAPGAQWAYSSTNYLILGRIIERASGRSLARELGTRILRPLRLRHTSLDTSARIRGRHAHGYKVIDGVSRDTTDQNPSWAGAAGGMTSTAPDLARFYRALLTGRLTGMRLLRQMMGTVPMGIPGNDYGLGLWRSAGLAITPFFELACGPAWGHSGDIPGYNTFAFSSEDGRRQFVIFLNEDTESRSRTGSVALTRVADAAYCG